MHGVCALRALVISNGREVSVKCAMCSVLDVEKPCSFIHGPYLHQEYIYIINERVECQMRYNGPCNKCLESNVTSHLLGHVTKPKGYLIEINEASIVELYNESRLPIL